MFLDCNLLYILISFINSLGYPDDAYYPNVTCEYIITAPRGKGVIVSIAGGLANSGSKVNITFYAGKYPSICTI